MGRSSRFATPSCIALLASSVAVGQGLNGFPLPGTNTLKTVKSFDRLWSDFEKIG